MNRPMLLSDMQVSFQGRHKLHVSSVAGNPELVCVIHCFDTH